MKIRKRLLAITMASCLVAMGMTGCGNSETQGSMSETSQSPSEGENLQIAVIVNSLSSEYWSYVQAGAEAYGEEHDGVEVKVMGPPSETSYDEQLNMIETTLQAGAYDGMVIAPSMPDSVNTIIQGTDMPIISVNSNLESEESLSFVGTGNEEAARQGGIAVVEAAKEAGWEEIVAINIGGIQGDPVHEDRTKGYQIGIEEAGGTFLENEIQYANCVADQAVTCMEAIMQTHPEGVAIIVCNNDEMAMSAARTAADNAAYANTIFCGFDGILSACESILDGEETMSVAQDPYGMGYQSVASCVAAIHGETLDAFVDTGCSIITADNAQEHMNTLKSYLDH
ncbi:MAG: sugar ABC transporter substrate-binding protein [Eubacteriales bacterium]|nr:sugar ABC transporter substrate-binding protein [Eubacteriales bacterium]